MILTTALFGIKEVIMLLVIVFAISYFTVKALTAADNKDRAKAMKDPINVAKEMGLEISPKYEKDNEIRQFIIDNTNITAEEYDAQARH